MTQPDHATDSDIRIDNVAEDAVGYALEHIGSRTGANNDATQSETVIRQYGCSQKTIVGSDDGHHHVANQKIGLRHCHIMFLRWLALDKVKHGRRALHTEETAHQSAQCSCTYLHFLCRWQLYALTEKHEVDANQDECNAKDTSQDVVFDTCQGKDGNGRDDDERQQNRPKPLPSDVTPQPPYDSSRSSDSQQSRECRSFAIAWHEEGQHRHNEDAETEARGALDETRTNAQQEYGDDNATQILNYPNNRCKGTKNIGFLTTFANKFASARPKGTLCLQRTGGTSAIQTSLIALGFLRPFGNKRPKVERHCPCLRIQMQRVSRCTLLI